VYPDKTVSGVFFDTFHGLVFSKFTMKNVLKIALVSEYFYPANNAPAARFRPLVQELSRFFSVLIYTSKVSAELQDEKIICNFTPFPENTRGIIYRLFFEVLYSIETFVRLMFSRCDIYYITSPSFFNCYTSYVYCRLFGKRYIIDIRDDYPRVFFDTGLIKEQSFMGRFLKSVETNFYKNAFMVVAATEGLATNIRTIYDGEVYLLRNGFSESIFSYNPDKYSIFTLVLHGNLSSFQGIDTVIALAKALESHHNELQILIIGKGSDDYKLKNLKSEVLKFMGPKPHYEISKIIERAHIGLSLRKGGKISEDAFPVRAYEYIGVCLPILVTPVSEAGRYIEKVNIGFQFNENQIEEIAAKVKDLMRDKSLYSSIVENLKVNRLAFSREALCKDFVAYLNARIAATSTSQKIL
jgi:glycosyltransferase involved in cell wall biosynthesis